MTLPRQPMIGLVFAASTGIAIADWFPNASIPFWIALSALALVSLVRPVVAVTYAVVIAGFFLLHSIAILRSPGLRLVQRLGDRARTVTARGAVVTEPKAEANGFSTFLFKLTSLELEGRTDPMRALVSVRWRGEVQFGDELQLTGIIEPIMPPRNPGEFDMRTFLARRDVRRSIFVRYPESGTLIRHGGGNRVLQAAQNSRAWMQRTLTRGLEDSPDVQNAICGMTLGLRHQTQDDIEEPFQQTGTLHLFAVAGLHVGMVARLLWTIASVARLRRRWATALIIPLLLFYAAITGLHVSSIRAAVMSAALLAGFFVERRVFAMNSLAAAAFGILCWDTNELFASGFQLSFAVVGTILLLADPLYRHFKRLFATDPFLPRQLFNWTRRFGVAVADFISGGLAVSFAAWIGSLPLIFWYYHLITPISLFANLAVVPIAYFVLAVGTLSLITAPLSSSIALVFNNANWLLTKSILALVHLFALLPGGHIYLAKSPWHDIGITKISVLDAGTGSAVHLHSSGANWLFDCGGQRGYNRSLREYLHFSGVNHLDGLLLTHGDAKHVGASEPLLADFPTRIVLDNAAPDRSSVHKHLREIFRQSAQPVRSIAAGDEWPLASGVHGKILFPPPNSDGSSADDAAVVLMVQTKGTRILMMSDSGPATEEALISSAVDLRADILVKGQHHSESSGSQPFIDAVKPRLIIATSRDFPPAERINDAWAEWVESRGIRLFRQDETGSIELRIGDAGWEAQAFITGEIFRINKR